MMMDTTKWLAAATLVGSLCGCSFNPIGESTFDCNRKENPSPFCRSFKALVKSTDGPLPESRFDKEFRMSDYDRATGIAPDDLTAASGRSEASAGGAALLPHQQVSSAGDPVAGMPVRKAPVIQRVWIKRFVDENDSLQEDVVVYREVQGPRWTGFEARGRDTQGPDAYPRRAPSASPAVAESAAPTQFHTDLAQPGRGSDGVDSPVMSPTGH